LDFLRSSKNFNNVPFLFPDILRVFFLYRSHPL
jgi:hypothetical protein